MDKQAYQRQYYLEHKTEFYERVKARRKALRLVIAKALENQCCICCGEEDVRCLEFHHVRGVKRRAIAEVSNFSSEAVLREELIKCEILCSNCHKKLHSHRI